MKPTYRAIPPALTDGGSIDAPLVDKRGIAHVNSSIRHFRRLSLPAAGAWTGFASLTEGACDAMRVDASAVVYAQPPERLPLAVDGTALSATNWTAGAGWSFSGGVATHAAAGGVATLSQTTATANPNDPIVVGGTYAVIFTVTNRTAGSVTVSLGTAAGTARSSNATFIEAITAATTGNVIFTPTNDFDGKVSAVWVIPNTLQIDPGGWEYSSAVKVVGVAAPGTPATLSTTIGVQLGWYRHPGVTEQA